MLRPSPIIEPRAAADRVRVGALWFAVLAMSPNLAFGQSRPVNPDVPEATEGTASDPTQPDAALRDVLGLDAATSRSAPARIRVAAIVAVGAKNPDVVLGIDDAFVAAVPGGTAISRQGFAVTTDALTRERVTLSSPQLRASMTFDLLPSADASSAVAADHIAVLDLRDVPLVDVCRALSNQSGVNVVPSQGAGATRINLFLRDVDVRTAIRTLCEAHGLWFRSDANSRVMRISTVEEYSRDLTDIQEETTEVFTLHYPNVFDVGRAIEDLFGDRVELDSSRDDDLREDLSDRLSRFDLFDARTQGFGQGINGARGGGGGRGGYGSGVYGVDEYGYGANNSRNNQYDDDGGSGSGAGLIGRERGSVRGSLSADEIRRLEELLQNTAQGFEQPMDVARELSRQYVAPIHVTIASRQNKLVVRTSDRAALEHIRELVEELDVPTSMVLLEIRILAVELVDGFESFFEYQWGNSSLQGEFTSGDIAAPSSGLGPGGSGLRAGDLIFQYVDSSFGVRLQALESENRVRTLATPVLLTANNEISRLFVGREVPLNRSFIGGQTLVNESTSTTATGTTSIEFRPVGTTLLVTPNINADRSVSLRIVQENSELNSTADVLVPSGSSFVSQTVDVVTSQSISGTIVAKDNLAVAFGGLIERSSTIETSGVPLLRDLPGIGFLFERNFTNDRKNEIVVVVKPYVIGTPADFARVPAETLENLGIDLDAFHTDPRDGEVLSPDGPFTKKRKFRVHGIDSPIPSIGGER
jgi:general secretion pathway protein D